MDYVYQPYPKWLYGPDSRSCIVKNAEEHAAVEKGWAAEKEVSVEDLSADDALPAMETVPESVESARESGEIELEQKSAADPNTPRRGRPPKTAIDPVLRQKFWADKGRKI